MASSQLPNSPPATEAHDEFSSTASVYSGRSTSSIFSKTFRLHSRHTSDVPFKGPFGLTNLHSPPSDHAVTAHIIFVHGLGGGSESTWTHNMTFWPRDLLPQVEAFHDTAIYSFGYNSDFTKSSILDINDFSKSLLARMLSEPLILNSRCPILLVGHSMGGLVIKRAYAIAVQHPGHEDLSARIKGIFFIATPQRGSNLAQVLSHIFRLSSGSKPFLKDLKSNSDVVQNINIEFGMHSKDLLLYSFYETKKLSLSALKDVLIVPKEDAVLNYHNEHSELLNGDHRSICKFSSPSDTNFKALWHTIAACIRSLQLASSASGGASEKPQPKQHSSANSLKLSNYLGVREPPAEDLQRIKSERLAGTCEWLLRSKAFEEWQDSQTARILWLRGPPGSGKSFVAGFAIDQYRKKGMALCYYFFTHGDKVKSSLETFLLSMAYQMAILFPAIAEKISDICRKDQDVGKAESRVLLRKLWEQGILNLLPVNSIVWVIDATDECQQEDELARFLTRVQEKGKGSVKIFVTTRNPATSYFSPPDHIIQADVKTADIQADIAAYLNTHIGGIPGTTAPERALLKDRILQKSNGCFLWAILVLRQLARIPGSQARLRAIDELPPGMNELYSRIVRSISERDVELSKFILTWVVTAVRAITVDELRFVLENYLYGSEAIESVEELISNNCHDLVYIDNKQQVRMRHDSARSFLVRSGRDLDFKHDHTMTVQVEEAHKMLAMACLDYLNGAEMNQAGGRRRRRRSRERSVFVFYASRAVLEHINNVAAGDDDIVARLATFLRNNVLAWIEHLARARDLETVLKMAQVLRIFLRRKPELGIMLGNDVAVIDDWATDLVKLVSKFGQQLLTYPESIFTLIPPFCPTNSAPYEQFAALPTMAVSVHGLSNTSWDDLLCTIELTQDGSYGLSSGTGSRRERLLCIATSEKHFCIGTSIGRIAIFNGQTCIQERSLEHGTGLPSREAGVLQVQFAASKPLLASISKRSVRIWNTSTWQQQWELRIPADCLALSFVDDDCNLYLALSNNEMWDLDLIDCRVVEQIKWTDRLDGKLAAFFRGSYPSHASFNTDLDLLAIAYRSNDVLVWNYEHDSYQIYNPDAGGRCEPTARSNLSVDTMVFSNLPDTSLLAVDYTTADMAVFDTVTGTMRGRKSKVYVTKLLSSPDGKTLAAARRDGVIELFDFETVHLLHRISTVDGALSALAFSADSTRLLEIRAGGRTCRVWDPSALFRRDVGHGSVQSPSNYSIDSGKMDHEEVEVVVGISAIECDYAGEYFFVGKDNGTVFIYDMRTGEAICALFSHKASVKLLHFNFKYNTLISVDTAGIIMIHRLERPAYNEVNWTATPILTHRPLQVNIRQVLQQTDMGRLLICADNKTSLFSLSPTTGEDTLLVAVDNSDDVDDGTELSRCWWAQHPEEPSLLLFLTPERLHIYTWDSLQRVSPPQGIPIFGDGLPSDLRLTDARTMSSGRLLGLIALPITHGTRGTTQFICLPSSELSEEPPADLSTTTPSTPSVIECLCIVGEWHERLVFLHLDGWVCSVRTMALLGGQSGDWAGDGVQHHFPPPTEWLRTNRELLVRVTRRGDLLFVVHGRVAVVQRGLDKSFDVGSTSLEGI